MKKVTRALVLAIFSLNTSLALADAKPILYTTIDPGDPLAPAYLFNSQNSVGHGTQRKQSGRLGPRLPLLYDPVTWTTENRDEALSPLLDDCNLNAMIALNSATAVVNYLKTHPYNNCLGFLWTYSTDQKKVFTVANLTAVLNEITAQAGQYSGTNAQNITELLFFIRVAFYQAFYHSSDLNFSQLRPLVTSALNRLFSNSHIYDNTDLAGSILDMLLNTSDSAEVTPGLMPALETGLNTIYNTINARLAFYNQRLAIYSALFTISRSVSNRIITTVTPSLINTLKKYALLVLSDSNNFIVNNAIWTLGQIAANIPASKSAAFSALEAAYTTQTQWSSPWLWAVSALTMKSDCVTLSTGNQVCLSTTRNTLKTRLFANVYNFDNASLVFNTSLSRAEVEPVYYATKEVTAQFGRVIKKLTPVPNDPNATLKMIIYATLSDYSNYQTFIYNLDSNNGGIYIEQDGTFYTYQRTKAESIYSLQELTRHEFTHYLIGRYLVTGMWGSVPIYDNNRMVFFDEGMAEFFAGSLPRDDIAQRVSLVSQIKSDGAARLNISNVVSSTYGDFKFYRYAGLFFHFLYKKHLDIMNNFNTLVYNTNINGFDALISQLKNNAPLNAEYQSYLDQAVQNVNQLGTPTSYAPNAANLVYNDPLQIQTILVNSQKVAQPVCSIAFNQTNLVYNCQGKISGAPLPSIDALAGWYGVNLALNQLLKSIIQPQPGTNLDWMTCRFEEMAWSNSGSSYIPTSAFYCTGPLGTSTTPPPTDAAKSVEADFKATRLGKSATCTAAGNIVTCNVPSSTTLVDISTSDSDMSLLVSKSINTIQTDVKKVSPTKYVNLSCQLKPNTLSIINYNSASKYAVFTALCQNPITFY